MTDERPPVSKTQLYLVPWFTLIAAMLVGLLPPGREIIAAAFRYSATDWMRDLWVMVTFVGAAVTAILGLIEWFIRRRISKWRNTDAMGDHLG